MTVLLKHLGLIQKAIILRIVLLQQVQTVLNKVDFLDEFHKLHKKFFV